MRTVMLSLLLGLSCAAPSCDGDNPGQVADPLRTARERMVSQQIVRRGLKEEAVLAAMRQVPRHEFVPDAVRDEAYEDTPLPIGFGQTISQPYIVALMTSLVRPRSTERALEIGTGSGYQAAVLSGLVKEVFTIELVEPLATQAEALLARLGYANVTVRAGDGYGGWPEHAPYDVIVVTAAPDHVPPALVDQLALGGRMVIPVGAVADTQYLRVIEKDAQGHIHHREGIPVRFVPLIHK